MPSDLAPVRFAVVKFVPDPVRDEPVNVGVVGMTDEGLEYRFLDSLSCFKSVLDADDIKGLGVVIKFLRSSMDRSRDRTLEDLQELLNGQVRLSELMGGLAEDAQAFLDDQFELYVSSSALTKKSRAGEDRTKIKDKIRKAFGARGRQSELFSLAKRKVRGRLGGFPFDFGVVNGHATFIHAISFQTREEYALNEAKILTWAAIDTKEAHADATVAAVVAPPLEPTPAYAEARRVLGSQAEILEATAEQLDPFMSALLSAPDVRPIPADWLIAELT
jgi:hypothetical protein